MKYKVTNVTDAHLSFKGNYLKPKETIVINSEEILKSNSQIKIVVDKVLSNSKGVEKKKENIKL